VPVWKGSENLAPHRESIPVLLDVTFYKYFTLKFDEVVLIKKEKCMYGRSSVCVDKWKNINIYAEKCFNTLGNNGR
jgi:hypothetical protein